MITVVLTRSRGAALSMALAVMIMVWRSRNMVLGLAFMILGGLALVTLAPESYLERLQTIRDYKNDGSAMGRLAAWKVAGNMIRARPVFGVGLDRFRDNYAAFDYDRPPGVPVERKSSRVAHNSYLQIWAECGTIAFAIYMSMLMLTLVDLWRVRRQASRRYHASWILSYATMFETSMFAFLCGSVFLNRAQFDLIYHYIAIVLIFGRLARAEMADEQRYPMRVTGRRFGPLAAIEGRGFGGVRVIPGFRDTRLLPGGAEASVRGDRSGFHGSLPGTDSRADRPHDARHRPPRAR
jgi:probable O-glycosylation ligase (exosortase A-associated)